MRSGSRSRPKRPGSDESCASGSWTINKSQGIPDSSFDGRFPFLLVIFIVWILRNALRKAKTTLELRQRRLRELLAALQAQE